MKAGLRTYVTDGKIDYKQLRKINPEAARRAVIDYLKTIGHNITFLTHSSESWRI